MTRDFPRKDCGARYSNWPEGPILSASEVRAQGFRNDHTSVGLLVVLKNREPCPPDRKTAPVQRVDELRLSSWPDGTTTANTRPTRLKRLEIAARRDLLELAQSQGAKPPNRMSWQR